MGGVSEVNVIHVDVVDSLIGPRVSAISGVVKHSHKVYVHLSAPCPEFGGGHCIHCHQAIRRTRVEQLLTPRFTVGGAVDVRSGHPICGSTAIGLATTANAIEVHVALILEGGGPSLATILSRNNLSNPTWGWGETPLAEGFLAVLGNVDVRRKFMSHRGILRLCAAPHTRRDIPYITRRKRSITRVGVQRTDVVK